MGEGYVCVELLFLPTVYAPCPTCHGSRFNAKTLEIKYRDKSIADVLAMTVDVAADFFAEEPQVFRAINHLRVGQINKITRLRRIRTEGLENRDLTI